MSSSDNVDMCHHHNVQVPRFKVNATGLITYIHAHLVIKFEHPFRDVKLQLNLQTINTCT